VIRKHVYKISNKIGALFLVSLNTFTTNVLKERPRGKTRRKRPVKKITGDFFIRIPLGGSLYDLY
jgi:hypothetical protein